jgi:hypothetical protein
MDIASVIVTSVLTCRVLPRFILDNRPEVSALGSSLTNRANVNFFLFNNFGTLCSLSCAGKSNNPFAFILFRTLLHKRISQLFCNQFVPHSLSKTPGGGYTPCPLSFCSRPILLPSLLSSSLSSRCSPVVKQWKTPPISFLFMPLRDSFLRSDGGYTSLCGN